MANRRPLVVDAGVTKELPSGDAVLAEEVIGSVSSGGDLELNSTSHATKGDVIIAGTFVIDVTSERVYLTPDGSSDIAIELIASPSAEMNLKNSSGTTVKVTLSGIELNRLRNGTGAIVLGGLSLDSELEPDPVGINHMTMFSTTTPPSAGSFRTSIYSDQASGASQLVVRTSSGTDVKLGAGKVTADQLVSTVASGTAPLTVTSPTVVTNLNADLLDGKHLTELPWPPGYGRPGAIYTINSDDFTVEPCSFVSDDGTTNMTLSSSLTKQSDAAWAAGDNAGAMDTGSRVASTVHYFWMVMDVTNSLVDVIMSVSNSSPTLPSGYTKKRLIGATYNVSGGGGLVSFRQAPTSFGGNYCEFTNITNTIGLSINVANLGTTETEYTVTALPQFASSKQRSMTFYANVRLDHASAQAMLLVSSGDVTLETPSQTLKPLAIARMPAAGVDSIGQLLLTATYDAKIVAISSDTNTTFAVKIQGFYWPIDA